MFTNLPNIFKSVLHSSEAQLHTLMLPANEKKNILKTHEYRNAIYKLNINLIAKFGLKIKSK